MDLRGDWYIFAGAALFVAIFVYALISAALLTARRVRNGPAMPPQFKNNPPLEIAGVAIPFLFVIGLFYVTYVREVKVDAVEPGPYATVDVTASQWTWQFQYPGHAISVTGTPQNPPVLVLPLEKTTQINLVSADVVHAFWIPGFLFKRDATPGYTMHFDITPNRTGVFPGACAEYCGLDHALMRFQVKVIPQAVYDRWIASGGNAAI